ncbi:MAG: hypothetical protein M3Z31_13650 [Pseudomonadota bacterium]|nr:hypothetical protein [Pseudomonadota bacterium]
MYKISTVVLTGFVDKPPNSENLAGPQAAPDGLSDGARAREGQKRAPAECHDGKMTNTPMLFMYKRR